jgi:hypothetical protein
VLSDLKRAIEAARPPVQVEMESYGDDVLLVAAQPLDLHACAKDKEKTCDAPADDLLRVESSLAEARFVPSDSLFASEGQGSAAAAIDRTNDPLLLVVDEQRKNIEVAGDRTSLGPNLAAAVRKANLKVTAAASADAVTFTATDPTVREIQLLWSRTDPYSNVLANQRRVPRAWVIDHTRVQSIPSTPLILRGAGVLAEVAATDWYGKPPAFDARKLADSINRQTSAVKASVHHAGALVLTATRLGALELRHQPGRADSNILNAATEVSWQALAAILEPNLAGVIVSWALLSLGAPFWYDMLKNLLKLRPAPAIAEEKQRRDRETQESDAKK